MEKSIIDLGIEVLDDQLMCKVLGIPGPTIVIQTAEPWPNLLERVYGRIEGMEIIDYWTERAKLRGYGTPVGIKKIEVLIHKGEKR